MQISAAPFEKTGNPSPSPVLNRYLPELDGVRTLAVLLVMIHHLQLRDTLPLRWLSEVGWAGVDVFFVLSGFLITNLLLAECSKTGNVKLRQFWIRRAIRIWPSFFMTLIISSLITWGISRHAPDVWAHWKSQILNYIFFAANYSKIFSGDISFPFGHFWSLAVEEHFYIVWPVLFWIFRNKRRTLLVLSVAMGAVMTAVRFTYFFKGHMDPVFIQRMAFSTETRADSILFGCILALALSEYRTSMNPGAFLALLPFSALIVLPLSLTPLSYDVIAMGSIALVLSAVMTPEYAPIRKILRSSPLGAIGKASYNIYLLHLPVFLIFFSLTGRFTHFKWNSYVTAVVAVAVSVLAGIAQYSVIDKPLASFRARFR